MGLPPSCAQGHDPDGPTAKHALTFIGEPLNWDCSIRCTSNARMPDDVGHVADDASGNDHDGDRDGDFESGHSDNIAQIDCL